MTMFLKSFIIFLNLFFGFQTSKGFSLNDFGSLAERSSSDGIRNKLSDSDEQLDSKDFEKDEEMFIFQDLEISSNKCCIRQRKLLDVGFDVTGNPHYVDIGLCKNICGNVRRGSIGSRGLHHHRQESCSVRSVCEPKSLRSEQFYLLDGVTDVDVIEDCECVERPTSCSRLSRIVVLFPETPYERRVDVGHCRGPCGHGVSCKAVRNKTISVDGPNGSSCVNVIEECSCRGNCYRARYRQVFIDFVWNDALNSTRENIKEVDVGQCVGHCDDVDKSFHCVLWDSKDSSKCLMSLRKRNSECVPTSFDTHVFTKRDGTLKTVLSVTECGCK